MEEEPDPVGPVHAALSRAVVNTERVCNIAAAARLQTVLLQYDRVVFEETGGGGTLPADGAAERAFTMHVAMLLKLSRYSAGVLVSSGLTLRNDLPRTMAAFAEGRCTQRQAFAAADQAEGLDPEQLAEFDAIAAQVVGTGAPAQVERELTRARVALAPDQEILRARAAATQRCVSVAALPDGMGELRWRATATDVAAVHDGLRQAAIAAHGRVGETRGLGALLSDVLADTVLHGLAVPSPFADDPSYPFERLGDPRVPGRKAIAVELMVIVPAATATGQTDEPAELAGIGAMDADTARHIVANSRTWTRVEVDPVDNAILAIDTHDRYIPKGLKRLIAARQPTCACGCNRPTHRADLDHVFRFEHDGRTRHTNLQGLCRSAHELKDAGYMTVTLPPDGRITWRDRWGGTKVEKPTFKIRVRRTGTDDCPF